MTFRPPSPVAALCSAFVLLMAARIASSQDSVALRPPARLGLTLGIASVDVPVGLGLSSRRQLSGGVTLIAPVADYLAMQFEGLLVQRIPTTECCVTISNRLQIPALLRLEVPVGEARAFLVAGPEGTYEVGGGESVDFAMATGGGIGFDAGGQHLTLGLRYEGRKRDEAAKTTLVASLEWPIDRASPVASNAPISHVTLGDTVRVQYRWGGSVIGTFSELRADTLDLLYRDGRNPIRIAFPEIRRIDVERGREPYGLVHGLARGGLIGLMLGGVAGGVAAGSSRHEINWLLGFWDSVRGIGTGIAEGAAVGTTVGGSIGAVAGLSFSQPRWLPAPNP